MTTTDTVWAVGFNKPGYLPDAEPTYWRNFKEAMDGMLGDLDCAWDEWVTIIEHDGLSCCEDDDSEWQKAVDIARAFMADEPNAHLHFDGYYTQTMPDGYVYWTAKLDADQVRELEDEGIL